MIIANNTVVSLRYIMKNIDGEIMEENMQSKPVQYIHGSNSILPALEAVLAGLQTGDKKIIAVTDKQLSGTVYFDLVIDNVRMATTEEIEKGAPGKEVSNNECGPGCCC